MLASNLIMAKSVSGGFEPTDLASLRAWYDASDATTITLDTGVSNWADKSGNGYDVSQSDTGLQPSYTTDLHLTFNNQRLFTTTTRFGLVANPDLLVLSVMKPTTSAGTAFFLQIGGATNSSGCLGVCASTRFVSFAWRYNNANERYTEALNGVTYITSFYHPANGNYVSSGLFLDGTEISAVSSGNGTLVPTNTNTFVYVGSGNDLSSGSSYRGDISEIVVLESVDNTDRQKVEGYLAWKWGLVANLPVGHPYKSVSP
jgi:hypothetical protein